jgi:hypothetical protein
MPKCAAVGSSPQPEPRIDTWAEHESRIDVLIRERLAWMTPESATNARTLSDKSTHQKFLAADLSKPYDLHAAVIKEVDAP